jgi:hypothetical protein
MLKPGGPRSGHLTLSQPIDSPSPSAAVGALVLQREYPVKSTESLGRPEATAGRNTVPGIAARVVFEVMTAGWRCSGAGHQSSSWAAR